jgi:hypothetical protein
LNAKRRFALADRHGACPVMPNDPVADADGMALFVLALIGATWGFVAGRWWALLAAAPVGLWISQVSEVDEVPPWFLGLASAAVSLLGISAGIATRRARTR